MLEMFYGRINRKTYIIGNIIAISVFIAISATIAVPLAIIDLAVFGSNTSDIFELFYYFIIVPLFLYYLYFIALMVRRMHDIGIPGMLLIILFTLGQVVGRLADLWILNLISLALIAALCILPGRKARNKFGNKPGKRFRLADLKPNI